jgi:hypothetical protein
MVPRLSADVEGWHARYPEGRSDLADHGPVRVDTVSRRGRTTWGPTLVGAPMGIGTPERIVH